MNAKVTLIYRFIIAVVFMASASFSYAVEVKGLYTGKILVTDKSQKTRVKAHRWAIEQVLTKVTGSREILENKTVQYEVRVKTANYIKSFTFDTDSQNRTFLVDRFDQTKIDALVRKVGASIWGKRRPKAALWLVLEEGLNRTIVNEHQFPQIAEVINQSGENRGLPLTLPAMDKQDRETVYSSDVWAKFDGIVSKASQRYEAEYFVMARLRAVDNFKEPEYQSGWLLDFSIFKDRRFLTKGTFNGDQFYVLKELVNSLGDYFASQYSVRNQQIKQQNIEFTISNLNNMLDLKLVEEHLTNLPPIKKVYLHEVNADQARFTLWLSGQGLDVVRALSLLPRFERIETQMVSQAPELSVDQQLDLLTKEYVGTDNKLSKTNEDIEQISTLNYKWINR